MAKKSSPIGVFDSGYGGLTILERFRYLLPEYDYLYLGDNARTPYGPRSYEIVYQFTLEAVKYLFNEGCELVILACNTASAKALRTIQQKDLPKMGKNKRVLGVIRPTAEVVVSASQSHHVGILATSGTVQSRTYDLEIEKLFPEMVVHSQACSMWVPLVENNEHTGAGADYFVQKYLDELLSKDPDIDTLVLACTHYPLLMPKIRKFVPANMNIISQGGLVAHSLRGYLNRHTELEKKISRNGTCRFLTTESAEKFSEAASIFLRNPLQAEKIVLGSK